jgi:hypothetical protein
MKILLPKSWVPLSIMVWVVPAWAGTLIESTDETRQTTRIMIEDKHIRIDTGDNSFLLIDTAKNRIYAVDNKDKRIIDISSVYTTKSKDSGQEKKYAIQLTKQGKGPVIAGYETEQYKLVVNGKYCSEEFLSLEAARLKDIQQFIKATASLSEQSPMDMDIPESVDPCEQAEMDLETYYQKYGVPMRSINTQGKVEHEVTKLTANTPFPPDTFKLPQGYEVVTMEEMEKQMRKAMEQMMPPEGMPDKAPHPMGDPSEMPPMDRESMQQMQQQMIKEMQKQLQEQPGD